MPDLDGELRHALEATIQQRLDAQAVQRGWDEAAASVMAVASPVGAGLDPSFAVVFATGYDGTLTTAPFTFDISLLGGPDLLM